MTVEKFEKLMLFCIDDEKKSIKFMFNPTELKFVCKNNLKDEKATEKKKGTPKVSFANQSPVSITLANLYYDTYEMDPQKGAKESQEFIDNLTGSCKFVSEKIQRPPVYILAWGQINYLYCFVSELNYTFTMFLSSGIPVRAKIDNIKLTQVDPSTLKIPPASSPSREANGRWYVEPDPEEPQQPQRKRAMTA